MLALSLTWSDPGPRDRTVRTGEDEQGMGLAGPIRQKHKPSRPDQAIGLKELWTKTFPPWPSTPASHPFSQGAEQKGSPTPDSFIEHLLSAGAHVSKGIDCRIVQNKKRRVREVDPHIQLPGLVSPTLLLSEKCEIFQNTEKY